MDNHIQDDDIDHNRHHDSKIVIHTADENRSPTSSMTLTPVPVIIAKNISKFFKAKSEMLIGNNNSIANHNNNSTMDVNAVLQDVDMIIEGRSVEDGLVLLRGMVADLLKEVDLLKFRLDETTATLKSTKEERDVVNNDYRDRLYSLILALQNATGDGDTPCNNTKAPSLLKLQQGGLLTADEATQLTIQTLTDKIVSLHSAMAQKDSDIAQLTEQMEDLQSENQAKTHKIAALEKQFKNINKKRHKVVTKMTDPKSDPASTNLHHHHPKTLAVVEHVPITHKQETTVSTTMTPNTSCSSSSSSSARSFTTTLMTNNNNHNNISPISSSDGSHSSFQKTTGRGGKSSRLVQLVDDL
jgi:uncharacterized coiled-coil protein SlyX